MSHASCTFNVSSLTPNSQLVSGTASLRAFSDHQSGPVMRCSHTHLELREVAASCFSMLYYSDRRPSYRRIVVLLGPSYRYGFRIARAFQNGTVFEKGYIYELLASETQRGNEETHSRRRSKQRLFSSKWRGARDRWRNMPSLRYTVHTATRLRLMNQSGRFPELDIKPQPSRPH
jgi:hypothetical protein